MINSGGTDRSIGGGCGADAESVELLTSIRGVGRWTAEMLLIFNPDGPRCSAGS